MGVNFIAVIVAAIAAMVLGFLWYGPLFGRLWIRLSNFTQKDMEKAKAKGMGKTYLISFIAGIVMSFVLARLLQWTTTATMTAALQLGFWVWLGFIAPVILGAVLWEGKSVQLYALNVGFQLLHTLLMAAILVAWP